MGTRGRPPADRAGTTPSRTAHVLTVLSVVAGLALAATACGSPVTAEPPPAQAGAPAPEPAAVTLPADPTTGATASAAAGGGGGDPAARPTRTRDRAARPPAAVASPIRVPLPTDELQGTPVGRAVEELEAAIRRACGGEACLSVVTSVLTEEDAGDIWPCETVRTVVGLQREPSEDGNRPFVVAGRGGSITLVVSGACPPGGSSADPSDDSTSSTDGATGTATADSGGSTGGSTASTEDRPDAPVAPDAPPVPVDVSASS